ncbi:hypothetical protein SASPL_108995 [Salvia splendens]|uniref:Uncharacterized protein n=1 Tax=Salvia splendens TaxID=180675 RepID=A0A8X8YJ88_SALSN|nr:hypothetical protein SASPL_108995 [Salvia splendens]
MFMEAFPFWALHCISSVLTVSFCLNCEETEGLHFISVRIWNRLLATHIDAVKEGEEEPVSFGPTSLLVNYGSDWKLHTVVDSNGYKGQVHIGREKVPKAYAHGVDGSHPMTERRSSPISFVYIGKILFAFLLLFVIGAVFTLFLENLPRLILYINSSI